MTEKVSQASTIKIQRQLPARPWKVLRLITRIEDFSSYMPNVKKSKIMEKTPAGVITEWLVEIDGLRIRWRQQDSFDFKNFTVNFKAIEGDIEKFEGSWVLKKGQGESTDVTIHARIRLGIPIVEDVVENILEFRVRKNFEMMLMAMEETLLRQRYQLSSGQVAKNVKGFVVMGHPYNFQHLVRIFKFFKPDVAKITPDFLLKIFELAPAYRGCDIKNFRSETGKVVDGYFVMCPIIPDMVKFGPEMVLQKVIEGCKIGERLGAGVLALGGFTSIVGEKYFDKLRDQIKMPITTGNTFTTAMALAGIRRAAHLMGIKMKNARAVVVGGTGDIGSACARALVREVRELIVTGRTPSSVKEIEKELKKVKGAKVSATLDNNAAVRNADIIMAAASASQSVVDVNLIKPGAVVCDVAYPKNISYTTKGRSDIFVFSGGLCTVPTPFNLGFDVGLPSPNILYGCFAEAIILSLEERYEKFSEGKGKIQPKKIEEIQAMGEKHGFRLAPFYWGDELVDEQSIGLAHAR